MNWALVLAGVALAGWLLTHARLRRAAAAAAAANRQMAAMVAQSAALRHDLHGILSPALLTADRLLTSQDPSVRRAGEVMLRTVDRATARLAETKEQSSAVGHQSSE